MREQQARRLDLLDYARLVAALCVVAFHWLFNGIVRHDIPTLTLGPLARVASYGYLGVELFFIISGYVIFFSARDKTPGEFAVSRAVRLFPAFWFAVIFTASVSAAWGGARMAVTLPQVLANLTMVPSIFGAAPVDGAYWTLVVELSFYGAVLLVLVAGWQRHLTTIFLWWPWVMLAATAGGLGRFRFLGGYYAFFAAGAIFAILRAQSLSRSGERWALASLMVAFLVGVAGAVERAMLGGVGKGVVYSPGAITLIIGAMFALFFFQNTRRGLSLRLPGSRLAGGLTYPIYLLHAHLGFILLSRFATDGNRLWVYPLVLAFVVGLAWAVHALVERRLAGFWSAFFARLVGRPVTVLSGVLQRPVLSRPRGVRR